MGVRPTLSLCLCLALTACGHHKPAPIYDLKLHGRSSGAATVIPGDSLSKIALRYNLTIEDIIRMNMIAGDNVQSGQRLNLPPPRSYMVRSGDTLNIIAGMFDVNPDALAHENHLTRPYAIYVGQMLALPPPGASTPQTASITPDIVPTGNGMFAMPVKGKVISSYGAKPGGLYNDGINIAAPAGSTVHAAGPGTVVYAGNGLSGYGNLVLIRHDDGYFTIYGHMADLRIAKGASVTRGQSIGSVGASGKVSEPQLHFEVRKGVKSLNPKAYL